MKKQHSILVALILALVVCSFTACSEGAPKKSGAVGTAIALGHGSCVTEVTVVVNGYGDPVKVQFDDIFPASNVYTNMALKKEGDTTEVVQVGTSSYFKYLRIGQHDCIVGRKRVKSVRKQIIFQHIHIAVKTQTRHLSD